MPTAFETFVGDELPRRASYLLSSEVGFVGDPNVSVLPILNGAPEGRAYYFDQTGNVLWYKEGPTSTDWVLAGGGGGGSGNWQVVADTGARGALTPTAGDRVRIMSLSQVQEYDGAVWQTVEKGNPALLGTLNDPTGILALFVDGNAGNDETGDGTTGNPWATHQRALDEIPAGAQGIVVIRTQGGAQTQITPDVDHIQSTNGLAIHIVGDVTAIETITVTASLGVIPNPSDPNGGSYHSVQNHTANPWATAIDEETHFLYRQVLIGGVQFPFVELPVGTSGGLTSHESNNVGGNILVLSLGSVVGAWDLCTHTTEIVRRPTDSNLRLRNSVRSEGVEITYYGCLFNDATSNAIDDVSVQGCLFSSATTMHGYFFSKVQKTGTAAFQVSAPHGGFLSGVFPDGLVSISGVATTDREVGSALTQFGPALLRGRDVGLPRKLVLGEADSLGLSIKNLDKVDFVGTAALCMEIHNSTVEFSNTSGVACENTQTGFATTSDNSSLIIVGGGWFGETSGLCVQMTDTASITGLGACDGNLSSALGATSEVRLGASVTLSFGAGTSSEVVSMTRFS